MCPSRVSAPRHQYKHLQFTPQPYQVCLALLLRAREMPRHRPAYRSLTELLLSCPVNSPVTSCPSQKPKFATGCWQGKSLPKNSEILHSSWNWDSSDLTSTIKSSLKFNGQSIINPIQTFSACKPGHQQHRNRFAARQPGTILSVFYREHKPCIVSNHSFIQHLDENTQTQERRYSSNQYLPVKIDGTNQRRVRQNNADP